VSAKLVVADAAAGNQTAVVDGLGKPAYYGYDGLSRRTLAVAADGGKTYFTYDAVGNMTELLDAEGHATGYEYDPLSRLTAMTDPLGESQYYAYDPVGNMTASKNPDGAATAFDYDYLSRRTSVVYPDGTYSYYVYGSGRLARAQDMRGWSYFTYDAAGRLTSEKDPAGVMTEHVYDALGRRTALKVSGSGAVYYSYRCLCQLVSAGAASPYLPSMSRS
jgi:YD repeat-containing protein